MLFEYKYLTTLFVIFLNLILFIIRFKVTDMPFISSIIIVGLILSIIDLSLYKIDELRIYEKVIRVICILFSTLSYIVFVIFR